MCGSMADIQTATAEIRRRKKKIEETTAQKYNGLPYSIGRPYQPHNMFSNTGCMITGYYGRPLAVMDRPLFFFAVVSFFFPLSSFFIPRLISAVADWMSTILLRMWP